VNVTMQLDTTGWGSALQKAAGVTRDLRAAGSEIAEVLIQAVHRNFVTGGGPITWAPLAPSTLRDRARKGFDGRPLLRTGGLFVSMTAIIGDTFVDVGSALIQAAPLFAKRSPFGLTTEDEAEIMGIYQRHIFASLVN
jgi:phage gpG-like protein